MSFRLQQYFLLLCTVFLLQGNAAAQDSVQQNEIPVLRFSATQLIAPLALTGAGAAVAPSFKYNVRDWRNDHFASFHTHADDALALSPIALVYILDWAGVRAKTDFWNRSAILVKAEAMCLVSVYGLKYTTLEWRPDGSDRHSFPSSHTAQAFLAATFISEEYKHRFPWMPYAAYSLASSVGLMRVANNRHYLNDVLIGAGIGILSQKLAYWTHGYRWGKKRKTVYRADF
ncbi:phosphatase PAP2 family protein [Rurimicrobium arvi]|uniref:phosphatase PAP2 family protein n=1 Tax=Rurimicrobium arvi TaxID=2049916 RepID=UPI0031D88423